MSSPTPDQPSGTNPPAPSPKRRPYGWYVVVCLLLAGGLAVVLGVTAALRGPGSAPASEIEYSALTAMVQAGKATSATIDDAALKVTAVGPDGAPVYAYYPAGAGKDLAVTLDKAGVDVDVAAPVRPSLLPSALLTLLPVIVIIGFLTVMMRRGSMGGGLAGMRLGRRAAPVEVPTTRFTDVAGADEAVSELAEIARFLHDPAPFERTGAVAPRGFLLVGAPGTGKTLMARAVAGEAGVPFFALSGADFVQTFVGQGPARVRELFEKARACERAIVFIDEIDAVGKARGTGPTSGANDERESTLNALLVEMDGFTRTPGLVMIAATNRVDVLDPALLRPGRFDRHIVVPSPDRGGREKLLRLYSANRPFDPDIDWTALARRVPGMTGAQIEQMLNEAALDAAREGADVIAAANLEAAVATTVLGRERTSAIVTDRDRRITAWHEAGHTVAALLEEHADDPVHVTIIPRGGAGGVTWMSGSEHDFMTREQARARLAVAMAGRAGEEILLGGDHTQGAHGDLASASALARAMVAEYGMGSRLVSLSAGMLAPGDAEQVNAEAATMLETALVRARSLLAAHADLLAAVAEGLLDAETLRADELLALRERYAPQAAPKS
jgi:cell division protease FtsH